MTTTEDTRKAFRIIGSTNDVTDCDYCGRTELKGTIRLVLLDADGNDETVVHYGTGCAATAGQRTVRDIRDSVKAADNAAREAEQVAAEAAESDFIAARDAWIAANIGPDALIRPRKYGYTSCIKVVDAFTTATGRKF